MPTQQYRTLGFVVPCFRDLRLTDPLGRAKHTGVVYMHTVLVQEPSLRPGRVIAPRSGSICYDACHGPIYPARLHRACWRFPMNTSGLRHSIAVCLGRQNGARMA